MHDGGDARRPVRLVRLVFACHETAAKVAVLADGVGLVAVRHDEVAPHRAHGMIDDEAGVRELHWCLRPARLPIPPSGHLFFVCVRKGKHNFLNTDRCCKFSCRQVHIFWFQSTDFNDICLILVHEIAVVSVFILTESNAATSRLLAVQSIYNIPAAPAEQLPLIFLQLPPDHHIFLRTGSQMLLQDPLQHPDPGKRYGSLYKPLMTAHGYD